MSWFEGISNALQDVGGVIDNAADIYGSLQQFKVDPTEVQIPKSVKTKPATVSDSVSTNPPGFDMTTVLLVGGAALALFLILRRK